MAERRLADALESFRALGATEVDGCVGSQRPMDAIRDALRGRHIDEIVISTLPAGVSRWLHQDLPHRVARWFELPVSHVIGERERVAV
jgi:GABA permease